ncbi:uncharacterized protein LOC131875882 [Cryptomeria japonica]|uniref:uncharacterized protein LOC131875882 n=1 Tax=Cryptomeria japonica TaxID=3369 RepID=UPI0027DA3EF5|nr:uncharacterized protein LOC131875882 [Cryptomeria japonica]
MGKFSISIPDIVIDHNISLTAFTLVGKFVGPRPNIDVVRAFAKKKWRLKGQVEISMMPKGFFPFNFSCLEDQEGVLCGGPWMVGRTFLSLIKWSPNQELNDSFFDLAPVWVKLSSLPMEFWFEDVFKGISSSFGDLLAIDSMTTARKRLVYARICVNVCQNTDMQSSIEIFSMLGKWVQTIE